jgi:hypothetical protein
MKNGGENVDLHSLVDSIRGVLAVGVAGSGALPDRVDSVIAIPPAGHCGGLSFQVLTLDSVASGTSSSRPSQRVTARR